MVLNQVQYFDKDEGKLRPILYRASFVEMVVPYAATESPHPRLVSSAIQSEPLLMLFDQKIRFRYWRVWIGSFSK